MPNDKVAFLSGRKVVKNASLFANLLDEVMSRSPWALHIHACWGRGEELVESTDYPWSALFSILLGVCGCIELLLFPRTNVGRRTICGRLVQDGICYGCQSLTGRMWGFSKMIISVTLL